MAELKELQSVAKGMSLLYIDENEEFLTTISSMLQRAFLRVDTANNATLGLGYLKVNSYDLIIVDAKSEIMSSEKLIENIYKHNKNQEIILTGSVSTKDALIELYALNISKFQPKPFKTSDFFTTIVEILSKVQYHRAFLTPQLETMQETLQLERKRIGRFMLQEKTLLKQIETYKDSININKNIYELTRLPSKFALQSRLGETQQSLLYINIDHFDFVNTTYGMGKANKLLKETAKRLNMFLASNATLFHITADEFVILLNEPSAQQAEILAQQIQSLFKESAIDFDTHTHFITFSIGIESGEGKKLFINAKAASKEARYFGGNQIVIFNLYSEYMKEQRSSLFWINTLTKAFKEDKIFTYYQPIVSNKSSTTKHYEVLCRLLDDENRLIDASKFIHSAKQVGLITQISKIVIDKTFKLFTKNSYNFSINISMHDLHEEYLLAFLNYKCQKYTIEKSRVHLEIVEDILLGSTESLDKQIASLRESGYHVIVDDFSTDKSAYNRMFELQAEYIKIDSSFIKELSKNKSYQIIVRSIVAFAQEVGIKTIAEHVEDKETYSIVKELGVDYSQGFYVGKPSLNLE